MSIENSMGEGKPEEELLSEVDIRKRAEEIDLKTDLSGLDVTPSSPAASTENYRDSLASLNTEGHTLTPGNIDMDGVDLIVKDAATETSQSSAEPSPKKSRQRREKPKLGLSDLKPAVIEKGQLKPEDFDNLSEESVEDGYGKSESRSSEAPKEESSIEQGPDAVPKEEEVEKSVTPARAKEEKSERKPPALKKVGKIRSEIAEKLDAPLPLTKEELSIERSDLKAQLRGAKYMEDADLEARVRDRIREVDQALLAIETLDQPAPAASAAEYTPAVPDEAPAEDAPVMPVDATPDAAVDELAPQPVIMSGAAVVGGTLAQTEGQMGALTKPELEKMRNFGYTYKEREEAKLYPEAAREKLDELTTENKAKASKISEIEIPTYTTPKVEKKTSFLSKLPVIGRFFGGKKEKGNESKETKAERKSWGEMTDTERKEKYGKTFEMRQQLHDMQKAREELAALGNKKGTPAYEAARKRYEQRRAEYVGARSWRVLKDKQKMAETEATKHQEGRFEKFRKGWRWMGEQNLEKMGWKPEGKFGKSVARFFSLRTAVSLGLLGAGIAVGVGSAVGMGALAARRVLGGTAAGMGTYDIIRAADENKARLNIEEMVDSPEKVKKLKTSEIEKALAELESRAKFGGKKLVRGEEYQKLRREYSSRINAQSDRQEAIVDALTKSGNVLESKQDAARSRERRMKGVGIAAGVVVGSGAMAQAIGNVSDSFSEMFNKVKGIIPGVTEEEVRGVVENGPALTKEGAGALIECENGIGAGGFGETGGVATGYGETAGAATGYGETAAGATGYGETFGAHENIEGLGIIDQGENAWVASHEYVKHGIITEKEFQEAWSSPASMAKLPNGEMVHISKLGLTHAGDHMNYVPATAGSPAHFEFSDNPLDSMPAGDNEALARAFDRAGKPRPEWLNKALGIVSESAAPEPQIVPEVGLAGEPVVEKADFGLESFEGVSKPIDASEALNMTQAAAAENVVGGVNAQFKTGFFGGITEVSLIEAPGQPLTPNELRSLYLDPTLRNVKIPNGMDAIQAQQQVEDNTRRLAVMKRYLAGAAREGKLNSPEAKYVRKGAEQVLRSSKIFFGDIYKPGIIK